MWLDLSWGMGFQALNHALDLLRFVHTICNNTHGLTSQGTQETLQAFVYAWEISKNHKSLFVLYINFLPVSSFKQELSLF